MRLKLAVQQAQKLGYRYIQRDNGNTLFDVVKYNVPLLDEEDIYSDDWMLPEQNKIGYLK